MPVADSSVTLKRRGAADALRTRFAGGGASLKSSATGRQRLMTCRHAGLLVSIGVLIALVGGCSSFDEEAMEVAALRAEREVIALAQEASALVAISEVTYSCDASEYRSPGGSVVADAGGAASAEQILERFERAARSDGWAPRDAEDTPPQGGEDRLVLTKEIDDWEFFVRVPGSGGELSAGPDSLAIGWGVDPAACPRSGQVTLR